MNINDKYLNRRPPPRDDDGERPPPRRRSSGGFGGFFLGILIGICLPFGAAFYLLSEGKIPVAVKAPPIPFEEFFARKALHAALSESLALQPTVAADEPNLLEGAKIYKQNCALCHGLPDEKPSAIALGLYPPPPQLYQQHKGVDDDPASETFWKVRNGIRLTGMPGFQDTLTDTEIWKVSLLLANGPKIPATVRAALRREPTPAPTPASMQAPPLAPTPAEAAGAPGAQAQLPAKTATPKAKAK